MSTIETVGNVTYTLDGGESVEFNPYKVLVSEAEFVENLASAGHGIHSVGISNLEIW